MASDYGKIIKALFGFKAHLSKTENEKFKILTNYFVSTEIETIEDEKVYPNPSEISKSTGLAKAKVISLIQDLYLETLEYFSNHSHVVSESIQIIYIHFPYDEEHTIHKNYKEEAKRMSLWIQVQLPFLPRLGEEINLNFIENNLKYDHGYVSEIVHDISCSKQRTVIHVHPLKNYYHQWDKLRAKHELQLKLNESRK